MDNDACTENCNPLRMQRDNPVRDKSYSFALQIIQLCLWLQHQQREYVLSKQLLRAGTSIGANIEEAQQAQSKKDFINKCSISLKEANESRYWLRLIRDSFPASDTQCTQLLHDLTEILKLLTAIIRSAKGS
jgi:four helix bundle protein